MTLNIQAPQPGSNAPTMNGQNLRSQDERSSQANRLSISSELTITPARIASASSQSAPAVPKQTHHATPSSDSSRVAGLVGVCAGCGALLALGLFLPIPARLERAGASSDQAWKHSYYIVAAVAMAVAAVCFFGFRNLQGEDGKGLHRLLPRSQTRPGQQELEDDLKSAWVRFRMAFMLAFNNGDIGIGYVGGFVARASSVALSLFIPLLVNAHFQSSGLCLEDMIDDMIEDRSDNPSGLPDLKRSCPKAYILAAQLSGVASLVGLIVAHPFGYSSSISKRFHLPLVFAAVLGVIGYIVFPITFAPEKTNSKGSAIDYLVACLLGMSQIGAVVSSLAILSSAVLKESAERQMLSQNPSTNTTGAGSPTTEHADGQAGFGASESSTLLPKDPQPDYPNLVSLKGAIAGIYSLFGGAGILLLTKAGGYLFDSLSFGSPFYIMAIFNALLLVLCISRIGIICFTR